MSTGFDPTLSGGIPGVGPLGSVEEGTVTTPTGTDGTSTIQSSQEQAQEEIPRAGIPWLPFPILGDIPDLKFNPEMIKFALANAQHEIVSTMLDKWQESIEQVNDDKREEELDKIRLGLNELFRPTASTLASKDNDSAAIAAATAVAIIMTIVVSGFGVSALSTVPGTEMTNGLANAAIAAELVPSNMAAELGLIGAMYAAAIFYPALAMTIGAAGGEATKVIDYEFAKNYAEQVINTLLNPAFDSFVIASVKTKSPNAANMTTEQLARMALIVKLSMLITSLSLLYKTETGGLTSQEIAAMLQGKMNFPPGDVRERIVSMVKMLLGELPETDRARLLEGFFTYIDSKPKLKDLLNPNQLLRTLGEDQEYELLTGKSV